MSRKITFVKKILANGSPCAKCADVEKKLQDGSQLQYIDETLIADERDPSSPGMQLASKLNVERAPFFVVEENGNTQVFTVYLKFVKEVLKKETSQLDLDQETLKNNSDLDYI